MSSRRAVMLTDVLAALGTLSAIMLLVVASMHDRARAQASLVAAARVEVAQNLLEAIRHGAAPQLPAGWHLQSTPAPEHLLTLTVTGPGIRLSTLITAGDHQ